MKKQHPVEMTTGSLWKNIFIFSVPLIFSSLLQILFNMADIAVIGRFSGSRALGAVGSTAILVTLFTGFSIGIGNGVNVQTALYRGSGDIPRMRETIHTSILIGISSGITLMLLAESISPFILRLLKTKDILLPGALIYLRILFLGLPAMTVFNCANGIMSAIGDTRRPLVFLSIAGVLNVALNLIAVILLGLAEAGVAIASVISEYTSAVLILCYLFRSSEDFSLRRRELRFSPAQCRRILSLGLLSGLSNSVFAIANLFTQSGVNTFDAIMVAGNSAATNADAIVYTVMAAFYVACSSFMSQNLGAGKKRRVLRSYRICVAYSFGIAALLGILLVCFGRPFLSLFTHEHDVIEAGMQRLTIMGLSYCVSAFMDCTIAASRGLGKTLVPMILIFFGSCVFRIAWIYTVFAHFRTIASLYLLYVFSFSITSLFEILYFRRIYRKAAAALSEE